VSLPWILLDRNKTLEELKDQRLNRRAAGIGEALTKFFGKALSTVFKITKELKRAYWVIHVFDREGDITEVFEKVNTLTHTGVLVRASHNRSLKNDDPHHLWEKLEAQPIVDYYEVDLIKTKKCKARKAKLAVRFCPVQLSSPARLGVDKELPVYVVYADEVDCPEGEEPVSWTLLTSEIVTTEVLIARSPQPPEILTVSWAIEAVARLGGYLEHRRETPIGIVVLWRGWAKLHDLIEGWQLARQT
jgi:hypothetical protein